MAGFLLRLLAMLAFAVIATSSWAGCLSSTFADGCSAAPTGSATAIADGIQFQQPNFFTSYAPQNGQTYVATPPWNVAGVNYPVGISAAYAGNLLNPATAPLPTGCSFRTTFVVCGGTASQPLNNLTINGYDFGLADVQLEIGFVTGTLTITNNRFFNGPTVDAQLEDVDITPDSTANVVMKYNYIDGNGPGIPNGQNGANVLDQSSGSLTFEYNALVNITSKGLYYGSYSDSPVTILYNYGEGMNYGTSGHADLITGGPGNTMTSEEIGFNTFLVDKTTAGGTANIYVSNGVDGGTVLTANVNNNVDVSNYDFNAPPIGTCLTFCPITSSYLIEAAHQDFGELNFVDNYFDPNGSFGCIAVLSAATTTTYSGNVDMIDGSTVGPGSCDYSAGILPTSAGGVPPIDDGGGSAVPEPPTWAMMLMACLVLGYATSRRRAHYGLGRRQPGSSPRLGDHLGSSPPACMRGPCR